MAAKWGVYIVWVGLLVWSVGCRTPQPVVKPDKTPDEFRVPPQEARYDSSAYPKQAYGTPEDPMKRYTADTKGVPSRSAMSPGGMAGMGRSAR